MGSSLAVQWLRTQHFYCGALVQFLVRELRSCKQHGKKKKKKNPNQDVLLSVKHTIIFEDVLSKKDCKIHC